MRLWEDFGIPYRTKTAINLQLNLPLFQFPRRLAFSPRFPTIQQVYNIVTVHASFTTRVDLSKAGGLVEFPREGTQKVIRAPATTSHGALEDPIDRSRLAPSPFPIGSLLFLHHTQNSFLDNTSGSLMASFNAPGHRLYLLRGTINKYLCVKIPEERSFIAGNRLVVVLDFPAPWIDADWLNGIQCDEVRRWRCLLLFFPVLRCTNRVS